MFAVVTMLSVGAFARPLPLRQLLPLALQAKLQPRVPFAVRSIMDLNSGNLRTADNPIVFQDQPSFAGSESDLMVFDFIVVDSDPTSVRLIRSSIDQSKQAPGHSSMVSCPPSRCTEAVLYAGVILYSAKQSALLVWTSTSGHFKPDASAHNLVGIDPDRFRDITILLAPVPNSLNDAVRSNSNGDAMRLRRGRSVDDDDDDDDDTTTAKPTKRTTRTSTTKSSTTITSTTSSVSSTTSTSYTKTTTTGTTTTATLTTVSSTTATATATTSTTDIAAKATGAPFSAQASAKKVPAETDQAVVPTAAAAANSSAIVIFSAESANGKSVPPATSVIIAVSVSVLILVMVAVVVFRRKANANPRLAARARGQKVPQQRHQHHRQRPTGAQHAPGPPDQNPAYPQVPYAAVAAVADIGTQHCNLVSPTYDEIVPGTLTMHLKPKLYEEPSTRQSQLYDDGEVPGAAGHFVQTGEDYASLENALQTYGSSTAAGGSSAQAQGEYALYEDFDENGNCGSSTADSAQAQGIHAFNLLYEDFDENDSDLDV